MSGSDEAQPATNPRSRHTFLACMGDATQINTWSSIPYHLLHEGKRRGVIHEGLALQPTDRRFRLGRILWNAGQALLGDRNGGYQYTARFHEALWRDFVPRLRGGSVINHFQFYPPSIVADKSIEKWFYLDGTLTLLASHYGRVASRRKRRELLARERENYHAAAGVMTMSQFAADSVVSDYGVPAAKVHVVVPGANFTQEEYNRWETRQPNDPPPLRDGPLRLVFAGYDWERKGLDRLLRALAIARRRGLKLILRVIGVARDQLPPALGDVSGVEWKGRIPRNAETDVFMQTLSECEIGCLLSRAELAGIVLREYLAFGMVVIGSGNGGCPEMLDRECSITVGADAGDEQIADVLLGLEADPAKFAQMRAMAWRHRRSALWTEPVALISRILDGR